MLQVSSERVVWTPGIRKGTFCSRNVLKNISKNLQRFIRHNHQCMFHHLHYHSTLCPWPYIFKSGIIFQDISIKTNIIVVCWNCIPQTSSWFSFIVWDFTKKIKNLKWTVFCYFFKSLNSWIILSFINFFLLLYSFNCTIEIFN